MIRNFVYTIKLVVQHKLMGTLDYLSKEFNASLEINEDDYNNPFDINSETVLNMMAIEIDKYLITKSYQRKDIDVVSYEVTTNDEYVTIYFSEEEADNTHIINPTIEAYISPESLLPQTPLLFDGTIISSNIIEWRWLTTGDCAYRLYNQDDEVIAEIGVGQDVYLETNLIADRNYARKLVSFNFEGESPSTKLVSVYVPAVSTSEIISLKEFALDDKIVREKTPIKKQVERLEAFHSGVGDNLDLLPQPINEIRINEKFKMNISLEGYKTQNVKLFTTIPFVYKLIANGKKNISDEIDTEVTFEVLPWTDCHINFKLESHIYNIFTFTVDYGIDVSYKDLYGYDRTKVMHYINSFSINSPMIAKELKDLKKYVLQDADISMAQTGTVSIDRIYEITPTENVDTFLDLNNVLYATIKVSPAWYVCNITKDLILSIDNGQEMQLISPSDIVMKNSFGEIYDGINKPVTRITYLNVDDGVNIFETTDGLEPVLIYGHYPELKAKLIVPSESYLISAKLNEATKVYTKKLTEMFSKLSNDFKYTLELSPQSVKGNCTVNTTTDSFPKEIDNKLYITSYYNKTGTLSIIGLPSTHFEDWTLASPNLNGSVNGYEPMLEEGDGKKDRTIVVPKFEIPIDVTDVTYSVEFVDDNHKLIDVHFGNEYSYNATHVNGDVLTFSSDEYEFGDVHSKWSGAVIRTEEFIIATSDLMKFNAFVYNPLYDPTSKVLELSDIKIVCTSTNPNVFVEPVNTGLIDFTSRGFKEAFEFKAKILSPSQNAWAPAIHPGYYYINNDEYFLYANPYPEGMYSLTEEYVNKEFLATIFATMETHNDVTDLSIKFSSKSSFSKGERHEVKVNNDGTIVLITTNDNFLIDEYPDVGYYLTESLGFGQSLDHVKVSWKNSFNDRYIKGYVSVLPEVLPGDTAVWTEFEEVQNGVTLFKPEPFTNFKIRMDLYRREHAGDVSYQKVYDKQSDLTAIGSSIINLNITNGLIEPINHSQPGEYTSPIYFTEYPIVDIVNIYLTVNHIITQNYEYELYYCTSDDLAYVSEGGANWIRIYDLLEKKHVDKYYRYKIIIPAGSNSVVYKITSTFEGDAILQSSPILSDLVIESNSPEWSIAKVITKTILCSVPMDILTHPVTDFTIVDLIYPEILSSGLRRPRIRSLKITTLDESVKLLYDNTGDSRLQASTDSIKKQQVKSKYINFELDPDNSNQHIGYLYPVPKLGYPVIATDDNTCSLKHVNFMDEKGNSTLTNVETFISDGRDAIALGYDWIDVDTLEITIDDQPARIKNVVDNIAYLIDNVTVGQVVKASYMITNSFIIDYNEYVDVDRAKMQVHLTTDAKDYKHIQVFYENNDTDNWYYANELELNPLYSDLNSGFVFLVDEIHEPSNITITMNPDVFDAGTVDSSYLLVKVTDEYGNAVSDLAIQVKADNGTILMTDNITNIFGIVKAKYFSPIDFGSDTITATCSDKNLTVSKDISIRQPVSSVFLNVTADKYLVSSKTNETVEITAKVFGENLVPFTAESTSCTATNKIHGVTISETKVTDINGEVRFVLKPFVNHNTDICRFKIVSRGVTEYIDIKVVD